MCWWWFRFLWCLKSIFQWIQCLSVEWNENNNIQDGKKLQFPVSSVDFFSCIEFLLWKSELFWKFLFVIVPSHHRVGEHYSPASFCLAKFDRIAKFSTFLLWPKIWKMCLYRMVVWTDLTSLLFWFNSYCATTLSHSRLGWERECELISMESYSISFCIILLLCASAVHGF